MATAGTSTVVGPGRVVTPDGVVPATVHVSGGRVVEVRAAPESSASRELIAPGFVDLQVNGVDEVDVAVADGHDWDRLDASLAASGVTAWLPTLVTRPLRDYDGPLARIESARRRGTGRPEVLGAHLEGPFLGDVHGAHTPEHVIPLALDWLATLPATVRLLTLGPEQPDAPAAIRLLTSKGVAVSLGHSAAGVADSTAAADAGATMVTHLFNAMGRLHHRAPGLAGVALADPRLVVGLIADLVHVHPTMLRIAFAAKGPARTALVTDAAAWSAPHVAAEGVAVVDGAPRLPDGTIAGSLLRMDQAVRNLVDPVGVAPGDALRAAATTPADVLGDGSRGRLAAGARADVVVLDADDLAVRRTVIAGETVFEA